MSNEIQTWREGQPSPYEGGDLTHFPDWRGKIVWDAFFNNLTAGLMLITTIAWAAGPKKFLMVLPVAMTAALLLLAIDLVILVLDLADPWRFPHSLRVMRLTSPLSVGVWALTSYGIFLGLAAILAWICFFTAGTNGSAYYFLFVLAKLCATMASLAAMVVICYKGVVFSCSSQPGVKDARWLTSFMISDSLLMGMALFILITLAFFPASFASVLILPFIALIVARCITFGLLWQNVKNRARLIYTWENRLLGALVYGLAGVIPLVLAFCGAPGLTLASILVLGCGIMERYWFIGLPAPLKPGTGQ